MKDLERSTNHREGKKSRSKIILQEDNKLTQRTQQQSEGTLTTLHNFTEKEKVKLIELKAQEISEQAVLAYTSRLKYVTPEEIKKAKQNVPWREHLSVTSVEGMLLDSNGFNDDIEREIQFYNLTLKNMQRAVVGLTEEGIPVQRPPNYEYEMFKSNNLQLNHTDNKLVKQQNRLQNVDEKQLRQQGKALENLIKQKKIKDLHKGKKQNQVEEWQKQINEKGNDNANLDASESHDPRRMKKNLRENKFKTTEKEDRGYGIEKKQIFKKGIKQLKTKRPGKISRMRTKSKLSSMKQKS